MRFMTLLLISWISVCCGCAAQYATDPPDESGAYNESPPPTGLDENPALPQPERPVTP